ncbi:uncharacterized protein LOC126831671 isoform X2 [Patella vulgata]|uniref:uncharacterized protein LOC126831671 isoform X2 n=1 Tax=Patella vulgata TaxID=6465 RepID=UPI00218040B2|nr:uncharacterized protein LOC126831671 isoform X2 [Patella vulgata]
MTMTSQWMGFMERAVIIKRDCLMDSRDTDGHQSVYVDRPSYLRDQALVQEQAKLSKDVERFGLAPLTQESERYRLKMEYQASNGFFKPPKRCMVTSFNNIKPEQSSPLPPLPPLVQGKKLLDPVKPRRNKLITKGSPSFLSEKQRVNETVRINLSRIPLQVRPTIPSIGRKAGRQEELAVQSHTLKSLKYSPAQKVTTRHRLRPLVSESPRPRSLKSHRLKFESLTDGDRIDVDYLNKHFFLCSMPPTTDRSVNSIKTTGKSQRIKSTKDSHVTVTPRRSKPLPKMLYKSDSALSFQTKKPIYRNRPTKKSDIFETYLLDSDDNYDHDSDRDCENASDDASSRIRIVVDMPNIILNAASPEPQSSRETTFVGTLSRACKQSEMRQKEIQNLLEDVKELNKRSQSFMEPTAT